MSASATNVVEDHPKHPSVVKLYWNRHYGRYHNTRGTNETAPSNPSSLTSKNAATLSAPDPDAPPELEPEPDPDPEPEPPPLVVLEPEPPLLVELAHGMELILALLEVKVKSAHCNCR